MFRPFACMSASGRGAMSVLLPVPRSTVLPLSISQISKIAMVSSPGPVLTVSAPAPGPDVVAPSNAYDALIRSAGLEAVVVWREDDIGEPRWTARPAAAWAEGGNHASRWRTRACSGLATLGQGAHVADVAWRSIGLDRTRAHAGRRVARARRVTLVDRRADHGVAAGARSILAGIRLRTRVRVRARRAVGDWRVLHASNRIATIGGARIVVVDRDGAPRLARARLAIIPRGARVAVAARCTVRFG